MCVSGCKVGKGKQGAFQEPSQENNLCSCLGETTEGLGGCGNCLSKLRQVSVLGILGDASHGLTQYLRNRGYQESQVLSSERVEQPLVSSIFLPSALLGSQLHLPLSFPLHCPGSQSRTCH